MPCSMYWTRAELEAGCTLPWDSRNELEKETDRKDKAKRVLSKEIDEFKRIINDLTAKLCYACKILDAEGWMAGSELRSFYLQHEMQDINRNNEDLHGLENAENKEDFLNNVKKRLMIQLNAVEKLALGLEDNAGEENVSNA